MEGVNQTHYYKYSNLPIKGVGSALIPNDAPPHKDLQLISEPHLLTIRLWIEEDLKTYNEVMSRIGKGWSVLRYEQVQWVESKENWMILLAYCDMSWEKPEAAPFLDAAPVYDGGSKKVYGKVRRNKANV